tara:strand:- start:1607 stop:2251 length:645 start_codon:yes stop_codon:yes gene_type:complete
MWKFTLYISLFLVDYSASLKLCVIGSGSGLGKELVYQGVNNYDSEIIALSSSKKQTVIPCRTNSFNEIKNNKLFNHPNIITGSYWEDLHNLEYDHLILTTSAKPFENDYSDSLTTKIIEDIPFKCKSISLVSAYGVGNSIKKSNAGIAIMNAWYLKDVYRAKNAQEKILNKFTESNNVKLKIYRPTALSYGETLLDSISRKNLANEILSDIHNQ